jgi:hypothetical protein
MADGAFYKRQPGGEFTGLGEGGLALSGHVRNCQLSDGLFELEEVTDGVVIVAGRAEVIHDLINEWLVVAQPLRDLETSVSVEAAGREGEEDGEVVGRALLPRDEPRGIRGRWEGEAWSDKGLREKGLGNVELVDAGRLVPLKPGVEGLVYLHQFSGI